MMVASLYKTRMILLFELRTVY